MRCTLTCLFLAASALALPAFAAEPTCEPDRIAEKYPELAGKTLLMGADSQTPPYAFLDPATNQLTGSDVDLAGKVFDCIGVDYEIRPAAWSGIFPAVVSGQIDLMFYIYYNETRARQADFITYMTAGTGAITQRGNPAGIASIDDLCGKTVAVGLGSIEEAQMKALSQECAAGGKDAVNIMTHSDYASGFRLVANRRADVMLNDLALIDRMVSEDPDVYERAFAIISDVQNGIAVKKGNTVLAQALLDGLRAVQAGGGEQEVFAKYGIDPALELPAELKTE